jgi:hypothetical protein
LALRLRAGYLTTLITILNDVEAAEGLSSEKFFSRDNK